MNPSNANLLIIAEQLIELFNSSLDKTRKALAEGVSLILQSAQIDSIVGRGLEKLLLDRVEFETEPNQDQLSFRQQVFQASSRSLQNPHVLKQSLDSYQNEVSVAINTPLAQLVSKLYGDLPPFQKIIAFRKTTPDSLLHRYNCAQVQGLLFHCEQLQLRLRSPEIASLRQLCKYLRFHQLLAQITSPHQGQFQIQISGPLSLFQQTQKYGMQLARFFPAVLQQTDWKLQATIRQRKQLPKELKLDSGCGIRSHSQQFLKYIPDELKVLAEGVAKKLPEWKIEIGSRFLPLEGEHYCFPDYTLYHSSGLQVHLELFHRWHAPPLLQRLEQLEGRGASLILGVERSLNKDPLLEDTLKKSAYFQQYGFFFRELISVDKLNTVLQQWQSSAQEEISLFSMIR